jgi:hypothetical protein
MDKGDRPEVGAEMIDDDVELLQKEWKSLVSELDLVVLPDVEMPDAEESDTDIEIGRGASGERPNRPFPSTVLSSEYDFGGNLLESGLLPAYAVAFANENIKPNPNDTGKAKMVAEFGAPGDYKESIAFGRTLPALSSASP